MRNQLLVMTFATTVVGPIGAGLLHGQTEAPQERPQVQDRHLESQRQSLLVRTLREEGIHAAAKLNGGEFVVEETLDRQTRARPSNLDELVRSAPVAVVGTVQSAATPRLISYGRSIATLYEVLVTETLRGPQRGSVTVLITGGRIEFPDGVVAEVRTPGFSVEIGKTYLWFLRPVPNGPDVDPDYIARDVHLLALGPQGLFDVSTARVHSLARADHPLRVQHEGRQVQTFLTELRATIQNVESRRQ